MTNETEIIELFTKILETITFTIEDLKVDEYQIGRGIFIIDYVGRHDSCSLKDIYDNTRFPASTASRRVDELVKVGYIERTRSPEDRREIVLRLTNNGKAIFKIFRDHREKSLKRFLKSIAEEEVSSFVKILRLLVESNEEIFTIL
jgi:DNA-binding MarR family transcriptional regulator